MFTTRENIRKLCDEYESINSRIANIRNYSNSVTATLLNTIEHNAKTKTTSTDLWDVLSEQVNSIVLDLIDKVKSLGEELNSYKSILKVYEDKKTFLLEEQNLLKVRQFQLEKDIEDARKLTLDVARDGKYGIMERIIDSRLEDINITCDTTNWWEDGDIPKPVGRKSIGTWMPPIMSM